MKKLRMKRIVLMIVSIVLLFVFVISVNAAEPYGSYCGRIEASEGSPITDLSGIEIKVFSANGSPNIGFRETYAFSVFTEQDGSFSFEKPTSYCSITINLETLPIGYGINRHVQFIAQGITSHTFGLYEVADVDIYLEYNQIQVRFYNQNHEWIGVDHQVVKDSFPSFDDYSSRELDQINTYDIIGKVITPKEEIPFSLPYDVSEETIYSKANIFYAEGMISEAKRMEIYCDIWLDPELDGELFCGTSFLGEILLYREKFLNNEIEHTSENFLLREKLERIAAETKNYLYIERTMEDGFVFRVFYDISQLPNYEDLSTVQAVADEFEKVYRYFVIELNCNRPIPDEGDIYTIYLNQDPAMSSNGVTSPVSLSPKGSYMRINAHEGSPLSDILPRQFYHAIMITYGFFPCESLQHTQNIFATLFAMIYQRHLF